MKANVLVALTAGLLGGFLSHYWDMRPVHAQEIISPAKEMRANEMRAERFVIVDGNNNVEGTLTFDSSDRRGDGSPAIKIYDSAGKVLFSVGGKGFRPLSE